MDASHPSRPKAKRRAGAAAPATEAHLVSLSVRDDAKPFGSVRDGEIILNARGVAIASCWRELGARRSGLVPDAFVVGPRRVEGILLLAASEAPALSEAIRLFKVLSALRLSRPPKAAGDGINAGVTPRGAGQGTPALWKKGYAEKRAAGAAELAAMRKALKRADGGVFKGPAGGRTSPRTG